MIVVTRYASCCIMFVCILHTSIPLHPYHQPPPTITSLSTLSLHSQLTSTLSLHSQLYHFTLNSITSLSTLSLHYQLYHFTQLTSTLSLHSQLYHFTLNSITSLSTLSLHSTHFNSITSLSTLFFSSVSIDHSIGGDIFFIASSKRNASERSGT